MSDEHNNPQSPQTIMDAAHRIHPFVERIGLMLNESAHLIMLFLIWIGVLWSALAELGPILSHGHPTLKDILLLFIYLELLAMVGIYFQTKRLPVRFLVYIAITALTRVLVVDVKLMDNWTLLTYAGAILLLTVAVLVIKFGSARYPSKPRID
ncbi:MAG: phosphate-starvation-inducible PsiE family protein [Halothiobacillaceae bacterium]|nr:phosphate-starvation-inducible PsiE family protein [Halothiobacillaceae bacterium]